MQGKVSGFFVYPIHVGYVVYVPFQKDKINQLFGASFYPYLFPLYIYLRNVDRIIVKVWFAVPIRFQLD